MLTEIKEREKQSLTSAELNVIEWINENEDKNGYIGYLPQPYSWYDGHEKGGINQYDFNVAFNISDRVYLGLTIGAYDVNYSKISTYGEEYG